MRTRFLPAALLAVLSLLGGCGSPLVLPPAPYPPVPVPVVEPPTPLPVGRRVVTQAEADAVPLGATEAQIRALFGPALKTLVLPDSDGVLMLVYSASTPTDPTRFAEFWLQDGRLVRTVVY